MRFSLQRKLLLLLLLAILIALSSSLLLRNLVIRDFKAFGEGRMLDRLYQVQAVLEGRYSQAGRWLPEQVATDLIWAWLSGIELTLYDTGNRVVLDTDRALALQPAPMRQRILAAHAGRPAADRSEPPQSYPLFYQGEEIGHLEARLPRPIHEAFFIRSSNRFLASSVVALGLLALLLSVVAARRITRPLQELTQAAEQLAQGAPGITVTGRTSDELGRLAAAFNRMAETLAAQERLRRQLVSNAAHELRTPLMVIRGELEGMMDGLLPTTPEALQSLHDEAGRLAAILDGVDELTRAQAAGLQLQLRPVRLLPLLRQITERFSRQAAEQQVRLTVEGDQELTARIDPDQFTRIIINLVSNALRAMPDGGQLAIRAAGTGSAAIVVEVADTGCGIPADQLPLIFERFYKGKTGGLGLGLAIVKELVEAHGGTISATGGPGAGACFTIQLPPCS